MNRPGYRETSGNASVLPAQVLAFRDHAELHPGQVHFPHKLFQIACALGFGYGKVKGVGEPGKMRLFILEHSQIITEGRALPEINFFIHNNTPM